jgi:hypothetical protein
MNEDEMREQLKRKMNEMVAAWAKIPVMVESGQLVKSSGNWYRIKDARIFKEISAVAQGFEFDKGGALARVQLSKPTKKFLALVAQYS